MTSYTEQTLQFIKEQFDSSEYLLENQIMKNYRYEHTLRVANIAKVIAERESLNQESLIIACLLHDVSYINEFSSENDWKNHGRVSADIARTFLLECGMAQKDIDEICYGIAIHVDDAADFQHEKTTLALSVSDADNIDRFDVYRLYENLAKSNFADMLLSDKMAYVENSIERLFKLKDETLATTTATVIWNERLIFYIDFYVKLREQLQNSSLLAL